MKIRRIVDGNMEVVDQVSMLEEFGGHGRLYSLQWNGVEPRTWQVSHGPI
jgi:hypothetical protein